jgi:hypothetical protein
VFRAWLQPCPHTRSPWATGSAPAPSTASAATGVSARLVGRMRASVNAWERTGHQALHAWAHAVWCRRRLAAHWSSAVRLGDSRPLWCALCGWVEHVAFERLRRQLRLLQPPLGLGLYQEARGALRWLQRHRGREGVALLTPPRTLHAVCDAYVVVPPPFFSCLLTGRVTLRLRVGSTWAPTVTLKRQGWPTTQLLLPPRITDCYCP